ncbi:glycosyltransferase family 4 protein [soil metagenome]
MSNRPPLHVLYVSHSFPLPGEPLSNVGGMQRVAVALHDALAQNPEVVLSSRVLETSWEQTGIRMVPFMGGLLRDLPGQVREKAIDVVLFSSMVTASSTLLLRRPLRRAGALTAAIPVGRDVTLPNRIYQRLVPRVLRSLDLVLPISRATGEECLQRGLLSEKMSVVPCGVDLDRFGASEARAPARETLLEQLALQGLSIHPGSLILFSVGRHQERKGFHWFVEQVMPRLPQQVIFLLGGEGPMSKTIREAVARNGLSDRVHLLGRVSEDDLPGIYRAADIFVMPNIPVPGDIEGFGVVMLEAGASGLPVIAADLEGIRDVVTPGSNGQLVQSGDADGFVSAIMRLLTAPDLLARSSARAAEHTAEHFGWPAIAARHIEILRGAAEVMRDRAD